MTLVVGFTGTRRGMTARQREELTVLLREHSSLQHATEFHHGVCVGADAQADAIAAERGLRVVGHPGPRGPLRSRFCRGEMLPAKPPLDRNRDIVAASTWMIAAPFEPTERPGGGTWYTVRYARELGKPLIIISPDGTLSFECFTS